MFAGPREVFNFSAAFVHMRRNGVGHMDVSSVVPTLE
jgi:hypothetical protein